MLERCQIKAHTLKGKQSQNLPFYEYAIII